MKGNKLSVFDNEEHISFIIGRGKVPESSLGNNETWIPCDISSFLFENSTDPFLNIDFCNVSDLQTLPSHRVKQIVFDISTWRFMKLSCQVVSEWKRILDPLNGFIAFEAGLSSVSKGCCLSFDFNNPSHLILPTDLYTKYVSSHSLLSLRYIYSASSKKSLGYSSSASSNASDIAKDYKTQTTEWYKEIFIDWNEFLFHTNKPYPISTRNPILEWYQVCA